MNIKKVLPLLLVVGLLVFLPQIAQADELEDINKKLDELTHSRELSVAATKPLEQRVGELEKQLAGIKLRVAAIEGDLAKKKKDLDNAESKLSEKQEELAMRIRKSYIRSYLDIPILTVFSQAEASELTRDLAYRQAQTDRDKEQITILALWIKDLETRRAKLESENQRLAAIKVKVDEESGFLKKEIAGAKAYQANLSSEIATLTARQQSILSARSGTFITSVGEVPIGEDFNASIAFKSQAPGNSFAVFAFGAYTHRNGMSQYGAKARAEVGQSAKDILSAYFPGSNLNENYDIPSTISVQGYGDISFKEYLLGIYEMPESWPMETLKAQAILARTYAIRSGKPICTTEACQVYKPAPKSGAWKDAVEQTERWVLENIPNAQYSSTTGGYLNNSGWDTTDKSNSGDWTTRAYESKAGSPWFYKAWYRSGYLNSSPNCGRSHPWLSQEEFSDIVNGAIVLANVSSDERILPTTVGQCAIGGNSSGNPYSLSELRDKASQHGGAVTSVSSASVTHNGNGQTTNVHLETNRGSIDILGADFKRAFNLRAPGYISIPQSGFAFFNIEKT